MSKSFYPRLAAQNCVKNGKFYFPYLLTVIGCSAAFYIILALSQTSALPEMSRYYYLNMFMFIGTYVLGFFAMIFLLYTNSFLMKRRSRELALYNILGMGKRNIGVVLSFEALYTWLIGAGGGILFGILLQRLMTMLVTKLMQIEVKYEFFISAFAILATGAFFGAVLLLTLIANLCRLHVQKPVELLQNSNAGEREPRTRWLLTAIGVLSLGGGYYMAISTNNAVKAIGIYFIAVFLVIVGTYCLFSAVSVAILKALRKNRRFYYRTGNFIGVSGMLHRMNRNAVGLANICILSTMVLVMISATLSLFLGTEDVINDRYPGDLNVSITYWTGQPFDAEKAERRLKAAVEKQGLQVKEILCFSLDEDNYELQGQDFLFTRNCYYGDGGDRVVAMLTAADYNKLSGQNMRLERGQILLSGKDCFEGEVIFHFIHFESGEEKILSFVSSPVPGNVALNDFNGYIGYVDYVIVPDLDTLKEIVEARIWARDKEGTATVNWTCRINTDGTEEDKIACSTAISDPEVVGLVEDEEMCWLSYSIETKAENRMDFINLNGGFFFLGVFLGVIFLMATVLIIYYKQISEGYEDRERFRIMRQVGLEKREIRRSINVQILIVFFAPLVVAGIHIAFDFNLVRLMLMLFGLNNGALTAWCTLGSFLVFALIYTGVYLLTAREYYRIVSSDTKE